MTRVVAFRHSSGEHLGWIADALDAGGSACWYVDLCQSPEAAVDVRDADALIFMGGAMSANDDLAYIRREISIIKEAIEHGKPVLGVCLGAQLIARALGANVYPN